jgi:hypothetical protein
MHAHERPKSARNQEIKVSTDQLALDRLYSRYGFKILDTAVQSVRAYSLRTGYFLNADIVGLDDLAPVQQVKEDLEASGFACSVRSFKSIEDAETQLFNGFFAAESSRERLTQEYERFAAKISRTLGRPYEYISGPFQALPAKSEADESVVDLLLRLLKSEGPALVILEAAAGFGKSCTAYEVLHRMLMSNGEQIPLLTELSLNRQAKIFRYVLLDEIDRNFPALRSELVREQIQAGRMPLIVDGFDELLSRTGGTTDHFEDAEPMLETISVLLKEQAKVLITTRRTAIFSQVEFEQWIEARPESFNVYRVRLNPPSIEDWLGHERVRRLSTENGAIFDLANPVLLSFLRNASDREFDALAAAPEELVRKYFVSLLEREKERQDLLITVADQLTVFRRLARDMAREQFTSEPREYLQLRIADANQEILEQTRLEYRKDERPTAEELALRIAGHALLDRRGTDESQVGFVNDFVLGSMLGDAISEGLIRSEDISDLETFVDYAVTAYRSRSSTERQGLWDRLSEVLPLFDENRQASIDLGLTGRMMRAFDGVSFAGLRVRGVQIGGDHFISNSVFLESTFTDVVFQADSLHGVTFVECSFYGCSVVEQATKENAVRLIACTGDVESLSALNDVALAADDAVETSTQEQQLESAVLENFWPKGRAHYAKAKQSRTLFRGHSKGSYSDIASAIERLRKRGLISFHQDQVVLNMTRRAEIMELLGRDD